jgi:hypothetical protein
MALTRLRFLSSLVACVVAFPVPLLAFDTPLSDTAVREAYFLGQRRDETMARFLAKYTKLLPPPSSGPQVYSVTFLTPFARLVEYSSRQTDYSAQQAEKDHNSDDEMVSIEVEIVLTQSYGPYLTKPTGSRSGSPTGIRLRSPGFWQATKFHIFDEKQEVTTDDITGEPQYQCTDDSCILIGATVRIQFPATAFTSETATIEVDPPEGEQVVVDFDLSSLR